jgi:hypothetical protein
MQSRKMMLPLLAVLVLGLAPFSFGQLLTKAPAAHKTLGYYDPTTGAFQPLPKPTDVEESATSVFGGTITLRLTINVKSTIPKNAVIGCSGTASVLDESSGTSFEEDGSAVATLVSGTQYLCVVKLPYSWTLTTPTTADKVYLAYTASMEYGYEATATNGTGTIVEGIAARLNTHTLAPIDVPINGATTTNSITITM